MRIESTPETTSGESWTVPEGGEHRQSLGISLAVSDPSRDLDRDLQAFVDLALGNGASRAAVVRAADVVIDPAIRESSHDPACMCSTYNLMSPPFSPNTEDFEHWLRGFKFGMIVQTEGRVSSDLPPVVQGEGRWCCRLGELRGNPGYRSTVVPLWKRLHEVMLLLEREGMRSGYYLSVGLVAGDCELCEVCDTGALCMFPYVARPSMEAVGIDVSETVGRLGWEPGGWGEASQEAGSYRSARMTGLFLLV